MLVGAMCSRFEIVREDPRYINQYIMTLGVLAPYRRLGIGGILLREALRIAEEYHGEKIVHKVYLHVQTNNDTAVAFYKRFGFSVRRRLENYYTRIEPTSSFVVQRVLEPLPDNVVVEEEGEAVVSEEEEDEKLETQNEKRAPMEATQ